MYSYYLNEALERISRDPQKSRMLDQFFSHFFSDGADLWTHHMNSLLDMNNRNFKRLIQEDGSFRNPRIYLYADINQKGNFTLEWSPLLRGLYQDEIESDFKWRPGYLVFTREPWPERLLWFQHIDEVRIYCTYGNKEAAKLLVKAIQYRIDEFQDFLKQHFDVVICSEFKIIPDGEKGPRGALYFDIENHSEEVVSKKIKESPELMDKQRKAMEKWAEKLGLNKVTDH